MRFNDFAAVAAVSLIFPVICCSCTSGKDTAKPETETPEAVEVKTECTKTEPAPAPEVKPEPAAPAKAEPAQEVKPEPVLVPETKKEPAAPAKAEPAPEAKKTALPCEHTVKTGDNLWRISLRYYGSGTKWKQILEANKDKIKKADFLEPGTILTIPAAK